MSEESNYSHSRHLRAILKAARLEQGLSAREVAERVSLILGGGGRSAQSVYHWENFSGHPPIDAFAAWARSLGYRLVVDLDSSVHPRFNVLLRHQEVVEIARAVDLASPEQRAAILALVRSMLQY